MPEDGAEQIGGMDEHRGKAMKAVLNRVRKSFERFRDPAECEDLCWVLQRVLSEREEESIVEKIPSLEMRRQLQLCLNTALDLEEKAWQEETAFARSLVRLQIRLMIGKLQECIGTDEELRILKEERWGEAEELDDEEREGCPLRNAYEYVSLHQFLDDDEDIDPEESSWPPIEVTPSLEDLLQEIRTKTDEEVKPGPSILRTSQSAESLRMSASLHVTFVENEPSTPSISLDTDVENLCLKRSDDVYPRESGQMYEEEFEEAEAFQESEIQLIARRKIRRLERRRRKRRNEKRIRANLPEFEEEMKMGSMGEWQLNCFCAEVRTASRGLWKVANEGRGHKGVSILI